MADSELGATKPLLGKPPNHFDSTDSETTLHPQPLSWKSRIVAFVCVILLVGNSIGQAQYARISYHRLTYHSYYLLCYVTNSALVLVFPLLFTADWLRKKLCMGSADTAFPYIQRQLESNPGFSVKMYLLVGIPLTLFNFFSSYTWYMSLNLLPVSINASLYKSSVLFIFGLSAVFLRERAAGSCPPCWYRSQAWRWWAWATI